MNDRHYTSLRDAGNALGERNDCTVIATAVVTGVDYLTAHAAVAKRGRKPRQGAYQRQYHAAIEDLGFKVTRVPAEHMRVVLNAKTTKTLVKQLRKYHPGTKMLVNTSRHVSAWDGNELQDWASERNKRIKSIFVVEPTDAKPAVVLTKPLNYKPAPRRKHNPAQFVQHQVIVTLLTDADQATYQYRSVRAAFADLNLPDKKHQKFRLELKAAGTAVYTDGYEQYEFTLVA